MTTRATESYPLLGVASFAFVVVVTVVVVVVVTRLTTDGPAHGSRDIPTWQPPIAPDAADKVLASLTTVRLARGVAYDRVGDFGPAWADVDHNGCDTRNDILRRDLTRTTTRVGTAGCVVTAGVLRDPYTGAVISFAKAHADEVQIDHLVPLHAAWMLGAFRWSTKTRLTYANDPAVLVAVSGQANQDKSDLLADSWKPPLQSSWCAYAASTIHVHQRYQLGVTVGERRALRSMLASCP